MNYNEAIALIGKPVTVWSWSGTYIGILRSVEKRRPWRGNVEILAVTSLDPVNPYLHKNSIKNQGSTNIKPFDGEIPDYEDSLNVLKQKLIDTIKTNDNYRGYVTSICIPMFKKHFPNEVVPEMKK